MTPSNHPTPALDSPEDRSADHPSPALDRPEDRAADHPSPAIDRPEDRAADHPTLALGPPEGGLTQPTPALDRHAGSLADSAIAWYDANARDLPWRVPGTSPWAVLVSEVMLQQTPVVRVTPAWHAWMTRWPTPADLAADPPSEAIRMWGRLGYPRRAMRLHACAVAMVERHGGRVPDDLEQLLALPGIGTYTARAVATFAYGQRHPVVDTNVRRVVSRAVEGLPDAGPTTTAADLVAMEELLPDDEPRAARASIAFMELGALICTARSPKCVDCPFYDVCTWRLSGAPPTAGPSRRPQRYAGTDRQVRGLLLEVLRHATGPVPRRRLDMVWSDEVQRARALAGLVEDGLVEPHGDLFVLAGDAPQVQAQQL